MKSNRSDLCQQRVDSPVVPPPGHLASSFRPGEESGKLTQPGIHIKDVHTVLPQSDSVQPSNPIIQPVVRYRKHKPRTGTYCTVLYCYTHTGPRAVASINQASTSVPPSPTRTRLERETRTHLYLCATAVRAPLQPQQPRPQRALARGT